MTSILRYYVSKVLAKMRLAVLCLQNKIQATEFGYLYTPQQKTPHRTLVFAFHDTRFVHLGDQLFHTSSIRAAGAAGQPVVITGDTPLFDFLTQGSQAKQCKDATEVDSAGALVIGAKDSLPDLVALYPTATIAGISYYPPDDMRIADYVHHTISGLLLRIGQAPLPLPSAQLWATPETSSDNVEFAIYNDFVASGMLQALLQRKLLRAHGKKLTQAGTRLIYLGSKHEASRPAPTWIHDDQRGKYHLSDLLVLFFARRIQLCVSFDTFLAHLAALSGTPVHIVPRKPDWEQFLARHFFPMSDHLPSAHISFITSKSTQAAE